MKNEIYTQTKLLSSSFVLLPETHQKAKDSVLEKVKTSWGHILGMGEGKPFSREHQPEPVVLWDAVVPVWGACPADTVHQLCQPTQSIRKSGWQFILKRNIPAIVMHKVQERANLSHQKGVHDFMIYQMKSEMAFHQVGLSIAFHIQSRQQ